MAQLNLYNATHIYLDFLLNMYALVLWIYWEVYYPQQEEISSTQFAVLRFGKAFGWDTQREYEVMEYLADKGLIRMNRQLMPYTILKLVNED